METFPEGRFDDLNTLLTTVGNFWTELFVGRELVYDMQRGNAFIERQIDQCAQELWDAVDRHTCPLYHTELVYPLILNEADGSAAGMLRYGDDAVFGVQPDDSKTYLYGVAQDASWQFGVAADLVDLPVITNNPTNPTAILINGLDFVIDQPNQRIVFATNPFVDARLTAEDDNGENVVRLYGVRAAFDTHYFSRFYGSLIDSVNTRSSPNYQKLITAVLDAIAETTTGRTLYRALEAITGVPFAAGAETVEAVTEDADGLLVITDANVYRYPANSVAVVDVGDEVQEGDALVGTVLVSQPTDGQVPAELTRLAIGAGLLSPAIDGTVVFPNADVAITVTEGVSGKTKITFPLGGDAAAVTDFFTEMHARGVTEGATLANYLDIRALPTTEPKAINLPATVNPLELLFQNLLGQSTTIVIVQPRLMGSDARIRDARLLRKLMNPHGSILFVFMPEALEDDATMDGDGDEDAAGYDESYVVTTSP